MYSRVRVGHTLEYVLSGCGVLYSTPRLRKMYSRVQNLHRVRGGSYTGLSLISEDNNICNNKMRNESRRERDRLAEREREGETERQRERKKRDRQTERKEERKKEREKRQTEN